MGNLRNLMINDHDLDCASPEVKRLYVREFKNGKQTFVPWGYTCICCRKVRLDPQWHESNESRYRRVRHKIAPKGRSYKGSFDMNERTKELLAAIQKARDEAGD